METGNWRQETGRIILILTFVLTGIAAYGLQHPAPSLKIENAYVRVAAQGMMSAAYFKISNSSDIPDTLYGVKADFAEMAQLHRSFRKNGMVGMNEVKLVVIPAKSSVVFKPGGYHVMLMNVKQDLKTGMRVRFRLMFKHSGQIEVESPVK
jgi:copper(I)-binding protein